MFYVVNTNPDYCKHIVNKPAFCPFGVPSKAKMKELVISTNSF